MKLPKNAWKKGVGRHKGDDFMEIAVPVTAQCGQFIYLRIVHCRIVNCNSYMIITNLHQHLTQLKYSVPCTNMSLQFQYNSFNVTNRIC